MKKKILISLLVLVIAVPTALFLTGSLPGQAAGEGDATEEQVEVDSHGNIISDETSLYLPLDPPFVVNFTHLDTLRYLQISLEVMYYDQELLDRVNAKMPAIRNELILLLSNQNYERLSTLPGKQEIREEMMVAINDIIHVDEETGGSGEIYITNFLMQ